MNKKMIRILLILILFLAAYNVVAFAFKFERNMVYWASYSFSMIAILLQTYIAYLAFNGAETSKSKFYGFPIINLGLWYLLIQMIAGFVFMTMSSEISLGIALAPQVIIFVVAMVGIITSYSIRETITAQDHQLEEETKAMKTLYNETVTLIFKTKGTEFENEVKKIADKIRYSDPISSLKTIELEKEINSLIVKIEKTLLDKDSDDIKTSLSKLSQIIEERNSACKTSK